MLQPKKSKYRKSHKMKIKGDAKRGYELAFGSFGIKAMDECRMTARQILAARDSYSPSMTREGHARIRVCPDPPVTSKPAEVRMGKGKGAPEYWMAPVKRGRIILEADGVPLEVAKEALRLAAQKLPIVTKFIVRRDYVEQTA